MSLVVAFLVWLVSNFGYDVNQLTLSNGVEIDNVDKVVYAYPNGYIVHFTFADSETFVVIYDNFDQMAIEISPNGAQYTDF